MKMYIYIYFNVSKQLFLQITVTLFQPQVITTMYNVIQLQVIKHINRHFVVLHTCTHTYHTRHICETQEIFRHTHNEKRQHFIEDFKKCALLN